MRVIAALLSVAIESLRLLDQFRIECDRRVENFGHRTALLRLAPEARKRRVVEIWHVALQSQHRSTDAEPLPSDSSVTAASVLSSVGVKPALCSKTAFALRITQLLLACFDWFASNRLLERVDIDRHLTQPLSRGGKDRIRDCGNDA